MKLNRMLLGFLGLGLLASCSQDDVVPGGPNNEAKPDGYIAISLQLPTSTGTRANDNFDDGAASEYAVNDGILVLFKAPANTAEGDATYLGAFDLGFPHNGENGSQNGNVTTSYKRAVKVTGVSLESTDRLYGLAMLNYGLVNTQLTDKGLVINGTTCVPTVAATANSAEVPGTKFSDIVDMIYDGSFTNIEGNGEVAKSIFMTNSPLSNVSGGKDEPVNAKITTLVDLTDGLYITEQEALDNPCGTIYVERAVAKITCSSFLGSKDGIIDSGLTLEDGTKLYIKDVKWAVGNEEPKSFIVRNTDGIDWTLASTNSKAAAFGKYRMVGEKWLLKNVDETEDANKEYLYRPYFCKDTNYGVDKTEGISDFRDFIAYNADQVFYTHENTFPVEQMKYRNTTRVGFWLTLVAGENGETRTFYTRNDENSKFYYDTNGKNPLESDVLVALSENSAVKDAWTAAVTQGASGSASFDATKDIEVETEADDSGLMKVTGIKFKSVTSDFDFSQLIGVYNATYQYKQFENGEVFYEVRVKHFGDDLTPWENEDFASSIDESYPLADRDNNYLGRYGLVRNNWYDLQIKSLLTLGYPRDPATWDATWNDTPDDSNDRYLAVRISVLSWAKRVQEVEF